MLLPAASGREASLCVRVCTEERAGRLCGITANQIKQAYWSRPGTGGGGGEINASNNPFTGSWPPRVQINLCACMCVWTYMCVGGWEEKTPAGLAALFIGCLICINRCNGAKRQLVRCICGLHSGGPRVAHGWQQNMVLTSLSDSWASQVFSSISLRWEGGASRTFRNRSWAWRPQCWQVPCSTSSIRERTYVWLVRIWKSSWHL